VTVSPTENTELFEHVVGGYGLFGVILDVELKITDNTVYDSQYRVIPYTSFPEVFANELSTNDSLGLFYGHLSTAPHNFLKEMLLYEYVTSPDQTMEIPPLAEGSHTKLKLKAARTWAAEADRKEAAQQIAERRR
jgi:FAD/FMN-containing dehydrogenase